MQLRKLCIHLYMCSDCSQLASPAAARMAKPTHQQLTAKGSQHRVHNVSSYLAPMTGGIPPIHLQQHTHGIYVQSSAYKPLSIPTVSGNQHMQTPHIHQAYMHISVKIAAINCTSLVVLLRTTCQRILSIHSIVVYKQTAHSHHSTNALCNRHPSCNTYDDL